MHTAYLWRTIPPADLLASRAESSSVSYCALIQPLHFITLVSLSVEAWIHSGIETDALLMCRRLSEPMAICAGNNLATISDAIPENVEMSKITEITFCVVLGSFWELERALESDVA